MHEGTHLHEDTFDEGSLLHGGSTLYESKKNKIKNIIKKKRIKEKRKKNYRLRVSVRGNSGIKKKKIKIYKKVKINNILIREKAYSCKSLFVQK